jgi:hypothetical protein
MLAAGNASAQTQGGMDSKPNDKPQVSASSRTGAKMEKHEKMKTQGNDVKLEAGKNNATGNTEIPKKQKSDAKKKENKSAK